VRRILVWRVGDPKPIKLIAGFSSLVVGFYQREDLSD
jgi:hypothetical protein